MESSKTDTKRPAREKADERRMPAFLRRRRVEDCTADTPVEERPSVPEYD
jgi:hypothetical protein